MAFYVIDSGRVLKCHGRNAKKGVGGWVGGGALSKTGLQKCRLTYSTCSDGKIDVAWCCMKIAEKSKASKIHELPCRLKIGVKRSLGATLLGWSFAADVSSFSWSTAPWQVRCESPSKFEWNIIYIVCIFRSLTHYITLRHAALHYTALRYIALRSLDSLHYSVLYTWPFITHGTLNHIYSIMWHHWYVFDIIATWCIKGQIQAKPRHAARSDSV